MQNNRASDKKGIFGAKVLSNKATRKRYWRANQLLGEDEQIIVEFGHTA